MNINRWLDYLGGIITVRIRGPYPEKIINLALSRGIFLFDVKRDGQDIILSMRRTGYQPLENIAESFGYELEVVKREGLPFYRRILHQRWMLLLGALVFILALYILSSFVWFLDIRGSTTVKPETIAKSAARYGLERWTFKGAVDKNRIEEGILREIPELSYVQVDIKGVRGTVRVVEKILPGEQVTGPCHLVAKKGGVVEEVMVLDGSAMVEKGDIVGLGNILISGMIVMTEEYPDEVIPPPRLVRAQGVVKARVWYEGYGEHPLVEETKFLTGNKSGRITLKTPWGKWVIKQPNETFKSFQSRKSNYQINTPWGKILWSQETVEETRVRIKEFEREKALELAREEALANLNNEMKAAEKILTTRTRLISSPSDTVVRIKAEAEVIEDICRSQPINIEEVVSFQA